MSDVDITKQFLIKPYNRLGIQREVGVPEAISHLLNISDHYTEGLFEHLYTSHLLRYVKRFSPDEEHESSTEDEWDGTLDSRLIVSNKTYVMISPFDDYVYRGPHLANRCMIIAQWCTSQERREALASHLNILSTSHIDNLFDKTHILF